MSNNEERIKELRTLLPSLGKILQSDDPPMFAIVMNGRITIEINTLTAGQEVRLPINVELARQRIEEWLG